MAAAITGNGRYFIQKLAKYIEKKLQGVLPSSKEYILYGDTDSCVGSTLIETNNGKIKIEDLYTSLSGIIEIKGENNYVKHIKTLIKAASVNNKKELEYNNIKYVMKHKVKKRMYKIKCSGDEVIITEDHSMIVLRDETLLEIKPKDVVKTDKLIKIYSKELEIEDNFEIEDLGIIEEWVYDIEVENNHNFFGNNILIHNSIYFHIEPFMQKYQEQNPNLSINDYVDWANNFEEKVIQPIIQNTVDDFSKELNAYNKSVIKAEREIISDCVVGKSGIKIIDERNNVVNLSMTKLAKKFGINIYSKNNEMIDISDKNILTLSYNNKTGKNELKQILNIQKKITTKQLVDLITPTGKKLRCTEDHLIAVLCDGETIYKMAKDITEFDDVQIYDNTFYTRENCELYNVEYINYGANRTDLIKKGISISKSKKANFILTKNKRQTVLNNRINKILEKHRGKYFKFILRLVDNKKKKLSRNKILKFLNNDERIKKLNLNIELLQNLIYIKTTNNRKNFIFKYKSKNKYGKTYFYKTNSKFKLKNGFKNMLKRATILLRIHKRQQKETPLHTAKSKYRREVNFYSKKSLRENKLKNIHLIDKYTFNVDHIVPIMYGFKNKIPPVLIGDIKNMVVISKIDNIKKGTRVDYNMVDYKLFKGYIEHDRN